MISNMFEELKAYLLTKLPSLGIAEENIVFFVDQITVEDGGKNETTSGFHAATLKYSGNINIEGFPKNNVALLALLIKTFIYDNFADEKFRHDLADPEFDLVAEDDFSLYIEASIDCADEAFLVPDENGAIDWMNTTFDSGEYAVDVAETVEVTS